MGITSVRSIVQYNRRVETFEGIVASLCVMKQRTNGHETIMALCPYIMEDEVNSMRTLEWELWTTVNSCTVLERFLHIKLELPPLVDSAGYFMSVSPCSKLNRKPCFGN